MDDDEGLNMLEFTNSKHNVIHILNIHIRLGVVVIMLLLEKKQPRCDEDERQSGEAQIPTQSEDRVFKGFASNVLVTKSSISLSLVTRTAWYVPEFHRIERQEDREAQKVSSVETYRLCRTSIA